MLDPLRVYFDRHFMWAIRMHLVQDVVRYPQQPIFCLLTAQIYQFEEIKNIQGFIT